MFHLPICDTARAVCFGISWILYQNDFQNQYSLQFVHNYFSCKWYCVLWLWAKKNLHLDYFVLLFFCFFLRSFAHSHGRCQCWEHRTRRLILQSNSFVKFIWCIHVQTKKWSKEYSMISVQYVAEKKSANWNRKKPKWVEKLRTVEHKKISPFCASMVCKIETQFWTLVFI